MPEVFTINGVPDETIFADATAVDVACAQQVKATLFAGSVLTVGAVPAGLFGIYKLARKNPGAGIASLLIAGGLGFIGTLMVSSAAQGFDRCRRAA